MTSKKESIEVGVSVAHSAGSVQRFDEPNRYLLLSRIVSILKAKLSKRAGFKEILEQVTIPASLLLSLTVPIFLLSVICGSFVFFWFAIPIIVFGIVCGVLLYRHRAKIAQPFISIASQIPPSR